MCGICGIVYLDTLRPVEPQRLDGMNRTLYHRGPDSEGSHLDAHVGLAMRRLAILDLDTGDQPIANEDGTVWIVFNGEIFNYRELRPELQRKGHRFRTRTDTEVIVHLYEEYGANCVTRLRGQFAFALWDAKARELLLARDRLGQKPLFYAQHDGAFLFASEPKAILQYPGFPRRANLGAIDHYLTLQYVPDPLSGFEGIHKLPPAHRLRLKDGRVETDRYWDLDYEPKWELPEPELRSRLREKITEAVRIRLISDVPLGLHLSGGIDSTIIAGIMAEAMDQPVKTFSIGFKETGFSELSYARQVAARFGTDHHEFILEPDAIDVLPRLVEHFDEPFADPAALPMWYLAQLTRRSVTVALNGDGGDESFAGYQRYRADRWVEAYRRIPRALRENLLNPILDALPLDSDRPADQSYAMSLRALSRASSLPLSASKVRWSSHFSQAEKASLYLEDPRQRSSRRATAELLEETFRQARATHPLDRTLYTDLHHFLPGALLPKVDRTTMAHSLEARSPFLDHELVELAARLPVAWKLPGRLTKRILRGLFADFFPPGLAQRSKAGFAVPLSLWLRGPLQTWARDLLTGSDARVRGLFRREGVAELLDQHQQQQADHGNRLWTLLNLELWLRTYRVAL